MKLISIKYIGKFGIHEHIMEMRHIAAQLNDIKIFISDAFMFHFTLISLPSKYDHFNIFYNTYNKVWIVNELPTKYV